MAHIDVSTVQQLRISLSNEALIVTPDSEAYEQSIKRWSETGERKAGIVVYPASAKDVSATVLFTRANELELAVCGGGHSTSGSSSTEGGVCIDLSQMRKVQVDPEQKTATAQGGALWADVDTACAEHGLATVGGTVNHTGVGGLTLGGGYGWLTGAYGLTIDNLLEAELVLADGSIVTSSHTENEDLFWAVRGAGACFGVATKFVYKAYEQKNEIWAGLLFFPPPLLEKVLEFANKQVEVTGGKHAMAVAFGAPPPANQPLILVIVMYNGPESEGKEFFAPLLKLGALMDTTCEMPYASLNGMINAMAPHGDRKSQKGSAYFCPLDASFAQNVLDDFTAFIERVPDAGRTVIIFEYLSPHQWMKVGPTDTAFANRGKYCNVLIGPTWSDKENDRVIRQWSREMAAKFQAEFERKKSESRVDKSTMEAVAQYSNYDGWGNTARGAFGVNTDRLVSLKKRYDPQNIFNRFVNLLAIEE